MKVITKKFAWAEFLNVPVLVQLKGPIVGVIVLQKQALGYASDQTAQWIPEPLGDDAGPTATQMISLAVLREAENSRWLIMDWQAMPEDKLAPPVPSNTNRRFATISTLVPVDCIAFVTRVVTVREPSLIIP